MSFKQYQSENYALREYVIHLQSRLLETVGEYPPPPPNVHLAHPTGQAPVTTEAQPETSTPLEAVAQAVAGLAAQEQLSSEQRDQYTNSTFKTDDNDEDTRTADEINSHLNDDEGTTA